MLKIDFFLISIAMRRDDFLKIVSVNVVILALVERKLTQKLELYAKLTYPCFGHLEGHKLFRSCLGSV